MTAADRQRRRRRRLREGRIVARVELDEVEATDALVAAGLLDPNLADDPAAIEQALDAAEVVVIGRRVTT
jgi:hypothetical protein